ncbi:DNA helicase [Rhizobiaceae bacterium BDR2-2]|uniref:DNA helicase n=1 Tax=Ectorhizobium quercum TaxID=2965071 RepID=A0AAE3N3D5_9HYPH|nr:DNA helicase [Ectorhizobium quercum]MCX8999177.1 DNA helicase [Ectorhizobium quercum]
MELSASIHRLKRKARLLAREQAIPLHEALDRIALQEGYRSWSLLAARHAAIAPATRFSRRLREGDLVLLGARPRQGKTLMALELAVEAMKSGRRSIFFTLEYTEKDILARFRAIGVEPAHFGDLFAFDCSDAISADYMMATLETAPAGTLVVVDYLQLLDQRRDTPPLALQVGRLKLFARQRGLVMVFISQIDRLYDLSTKPHPGIQDVRLPNPLDLTLFDKACFLHEGEIRFHMPG